MQTYSFRARLSLIGLALGAVLLALLLTGYGLASAAATSGGGQLQPTVGGQSGVNDQYVNYTLRVTNTSLLFDVITMTVSGNNWPTQMYIVSGTVIIPNTTILLGLNAGEGRDILVQVYVSLNASGHDVALITAQSTSSPAVSATSTLTTSVGYKLYLPMVTR